ncbi:cation diffusion facilitator family transporter [Anthocerotibacter panamensis]|uniref:cation diffusion facilitator family transporter n=1 Tax=Anthocerotibacter panamensis TaxID=2857077 RepID=UPI001C4055A1|nr:cation diffusion facilitator family transporter [Anthocerotibacter panamensis]
MRLDGTARSYAAVSLGAALLTIGLKTWAYALTGSVGLLSDAIESLVNLVAAGFVLWALTLAAQPPDAEHSFGHSKVEYFSSGLEGALILVAAGSIALTAWDRFLHPQPIAQLGLGLVASLVATAINGGAALILLRAGRRLNSITLRADGQHLLTDVWTTGGVVLGLVLVQITGWLLLDSWIAMMVAASIMWTGIRLLRETVRGLMDESLPESEQQIITCILAEYEPQGIQFHALRTRVSGARRFVLLHVLVPGAWSVQQGHDLCEEIEVAISNTLPGTNVTTHLEPLEDPASWADVGLDRQLPEIRSRPVSQA